VRNAKSDAEDYLRTSHIAQPATITPPKTVAEHIAGGFTVRNAEHYGCDQREDERRAEVSKLDRHDFFPMAMW
jgi:hypothetical protein